jgi:hypothetical protein
MDWKKLLMPDWKKIILFLIVGIILFNINWFVPEDCVDCTYSQGLPLPVYYWGGFAGFPKTFILVTFIIDVIIWYLISCFIFWIYKKFKKKK